MKKFLNLVFLIALMSCSTQSTRQESDHDTFLVAIEHAREEGRKVLQTSKEMIEEKTLIVGGCWDYINAVYNKSGFNTKERKVVFKSKYHGPYVDTKLIEAGDWLYFVNHSYKDIEHSAIFISWIDEDKKEALMVNYVGQNKKQPATLKRLVLDNVYYIIRGQN